MIGVSANHCMVVTVDISICQDIFMCVIVMDWYKGAHINIMHYQTTFIDNRPGVRYIVSVSRYIWLKANVLFRYF